MGVSCKENVIFWPENKEQYFENLGIIGKLLLNGIWNKNGGCRKGVDWIQPAQDKAQ
jgi:hypothetical protein